MNSFCAGSAKWLKAAQRSSVGAGRNVSGRWCGADIALYKNIIYLFYSY